MGCRPLLVASACHCITRGCVVRACACSSSVRICPSGFLASNERIPGRYSVQIQIASGIKCNAVTYEDLCEKVRRSRALGGVGGWWTKAFFLSNAHIHAENLACKCAHTMRLTEHNSFHVGLQREQSDSCWPNGRCVFTRSFPAHAFVVATFAIVRTTKQTNNQPNAHTRTHARTHTNTHDMRIAHTHTLSCIHHTLNRHWAPSATISCRQ